MWLLIVITLLTLTQSIETAKDGHLALNQIHHEMSQIHERANKYQLETEVYDASPIEVHDWILERNTTWIESFGETYGEMDISGGIKEQNELLELWEEEQTGGVTDEVRGKVVEGFAGLDGLKNLKESISRLNGSEMEQKVRFMKARLSGVQHIEYWRLSYTLEEILEYFKPVVDGIEALTSEYPKIDGLSIGDKNKIIDKLKGILKNGEYGTMTMLDIQRHFRMAGFIEYENQGKFENSPFEELLEIADKVISETETIRKLEELTKSPELISQAMGRLERLKSSPIKNVLESVETDMEKLRGYRISEEVFKKYQGIPSLHPLLQKIRSLTSYMKRLELKMKHLSKSWNPLKEHFQTLDIPDDMSTEKLEGLAECLGKYDFPIVSKGAELEHFEHSFKRILPLQEELKETLEPFLNFMNRDTLDVFRLMKADTTVELNNMTYPFLNDLSTNCSKLMELIHTREKTYGNHTGFFENITNRILDEVNRLDLDGAQTAAVNLLGNLKSVEQLLVCYDDLKVTSSDIQNLLDKDKWNFDPQVLECTVDVIGLFKEAHKRMKELSEWKPSDSSHNRFVLTAEGVQKITVVLEALESIRKVQKMWKSLKTLEIQNPDWELLSSSLTSFLEGLSQLDSTFEFFINTPFPQTLPIDSIRKFIKEDYQGSHRWDILKFLDRIQLLQVQYPTADMVQNLKEALKEMKDWEKPVEKIQPYVDCSENTCDIPPKFTEVGPDGA